MWETNEQDLDQNHSAEPSRPVDNDQSSNLRPNTGASPSETTSGDHLKTPCLACIRPTLTNPKSWMAETENCLNGGFHRSNGDLFEKIGQRSYPGRRLVSERRVTIENRRVVISMHHLSCSAFKHEPRSEELRWRGRVVYFLMKLLASFAFNYSCQSRRSKLRTMPVRVRGNSRSGAHLSALALETTDALLSPLSSHLRRWSVQELKVSDCFSRPELKFLERGATHNSARMSRDG